MIENGSKEAPAKMIRRSHDPVSPSARRSIAILIVGLAAVSAAVLGASPAGAADPSISVSPATGLHAGQTVTVTGSGFGKDAQVYIVECVAGASSETQCSFDFSDLSTVVVAKADASGNLHSTSPVLKTSFKTTDCTKVACEIAAHQTISFTLSAANTATHSISFGASAHPSNPPATSSAASRPTTAAAGSTTATASSSASAATSATASASTGASTPASGATAPAPTSGTPGTPGSSGTSAAIGAASPSTAARTIKVKAKNGGRYAVVAIVAVLAVAFVGVMAASGRRRRT